MHDDANLVANSSTIPSSPRESLAALQDTLVNGTELDQRVGYGLDHSGWKENREREIERERGIEKGGSNSGGGGGNSLEARGGGGQRCKLINRVIPRK